MNSMWYRYARRTSSLFLLIACSAHAQLPQCSTQKVNGNCALVFDRLNPVSLPTIQMRPGARISISVVGPLPYEALSLDPQSFQGLTPSDQTQGFVSALMPSLKGVSTPTVSVLVVEGSEDVKKVKSDLAALESSLNNPFPVIQTFITNAQGFYAQVQEAVAPLPRPRADGDTPMRTAVIPPGTPYPWSESYPKWVSLLLCELSAAECTGAVHATFMDLMATGTNVQTLVTPTPATPASPAGPPPLQFDTSTFDSNVSQTEKDIKKLKPKELPETYAAELDALRKREGLLIKEIPIYAAAWLPGVTAINKDLQTYFVNVKETTGRSPAKEHQDLGFIDDPRYLSRNNRASTRFLGRLVTYSINSVNQISVMTTAVPATAQKTSIATITVLYADPKFEVSTGFLLSWLPNRTFANQTLVNTNTGGTPSTGNIIITQSTVRPIVLPYVGANFRLWHDFTIRQRRAAVYWTTAVAFNGYNTTAEYAVGPSFSWRMIMLSPLFHIGHDTHLTQGETVGQVWCNTSAAAGSATACAGSPPAPSSKIFWRGAFALGIGIRIPTSFGTTAGH